MFALARRCSLCPVPGRSARRRTEPSHPPPDRADAADFPEGSLETREGRIAAAIRLYEQVGDTTPNKPGVLQQPEMNALKERRQILELIESMSGGKATEDRLAALEDSNAALLERMESAGSGEAIAPPIVSEDSAGVH